MDLKTYLQSLSIADREPFAKKLDSSAGHLQNVAYGYRPCAPALALERETSGTVTRQELRDDWRAIWPELNTAKAWQLMTKRICEILLWAFVPINAVFALVNCLDFLLTGDALPFIGFVVASVATAMCVSTLREA
jgi:DNA-binding transcriptional regulator YdaS (Cro superfamily)